MPTPELSSSQKRILTSLVNLANDDEDVVQGREIAEAIDRNPGTIRNQMQTLRALQLVEGVPGPKGGYRPTMEAYEALDVERMDDPVRVPVEREGTAMADVNVEEIDLTTVLDPDTCRAEVVLQGSIRDFEQGDAVRVGPTPNTDLRLDGIVDAVNVIESTLIVRIRTVDASADGTAGVSAAD